MACAINFSPRVMILSAPGCRKISQHTKFRNLNALLHGKECASVVGSKRYFWDQNVRRLPSIVEDKTANLKGISYVLNEVVGKSDIMHPYNPLGNDPRRWMIMLSIQNRILDMEAIITANRLLPGSQTLSMIATILHKCPVGFWHVETKWSEIFQKTDNPRVKRLIALLVEGDIEQERFCVAMGNFFLMAPSTDFGAPPLTEFEPDEIELVLQLYFGRKNDVNFQLDCVTEVLMKTL